MIVSGARAMNRFKLSKFRPIRIILISFFLLFVTSHSIAFATENTYRKFPTNHSIKTTNITTSSANANIGFADFVLGLVKSEWHSITNGVSKVYHFFIKKSNTQNISIQNTNTTNIQKPKENDLSPNISDTPPMTDNIPVVDNTIITIEQPNQVNPVKNTNETQIATGGQGPMGPRGFTGPQGPKGIDGKDSNVDTSSFVSKSFFDSQISRVFDSVDKVQGNVSSGALLASGATIGSISQAQEFAKGIVSSYFTGGSDIASNITYKSTTGVGTSTGIAHQFIGGSNGGTVIETMLNNGSVGIGTTNPLHKLEIAGSDNGWDTIASVIFNDTYNDVNTRNWGIYNGAISFGDLEFLVGGGQNINPDSGTNVLTLKRTGEVLLPQGILSLKGSSSGTTNFAVPATAGAYTFTLPPNGGTSGYVLSTNGSGATSWIADGSGTSQWVTQGSHIYYNTGGNVGIGDTAPTEKLSIAGNISLTGEIHNPSDTSGLTLGMINSSTIVGSYFRAYGTNSGGAIQKGSAEFTVDTRSNANAALNVIGYDGVSWVNTMAVLGLGQVGIGTTNPTATLQIRARSNAFGSLLVNSSSGGGGGIFMGTSTVLGGLTYNFFSPNSLEFYTGQSNVTPVAGNVKMVLTNTGNLGVGNTNPGELLTLGTTGTTTGVLSFAGSTSGKVIVQPANAAGTWTLTLPTGVGGAGQQLTDVAGDGVTSWQAAGSTRNLKNIIDTVTNPDEALNQILNTPIYRFHYKAGMGTGDSQTEYVGVMADEAPWAMHYNGTIINPVNTLGYMILGIKGINSKLDGLLLKINDLSSLDTTSSNSLGSLIKTFLADTENSIANIFADRIHSKEICVSDNSGETCITKSQLDSLLSSAGISINNNQPQNPPVEPPPTCVLPQTLVDGICVEGTPTAPLTCTENQTLVDGVCTDTLPAN